MTDVADKSFAPSCKANGCPLAATVVTHWWETDSPKEKRQPKWGVCEYHHEAPGPQWTATTRVIQQNIKIIRLYQAMQNITDERIKPIPGERVSDWLTRCGDVVRRTVLPSQSAPVVMPKLEFSQLYQQISTPARSTNDS